MTCLAGAQYTFGYMLALLRAMQSPDQDRIDPRELVKQAAYGHADNVRAIVKAHPNKVGMLPVDKAPSEHSTTLTCCSMRHSIGHKAEKRNCMRLLSTPVYI